MATLGTKNVHSAMVLCLDVTIELVIFKQNGKMAPIFFGNINNYCHEYIDFNC